MPEEATAGPNDTQLMLRLREVERRHRQNRKVGNIFLAFIALTIISGAYTIPTFQASTTFPIALSILGLWLLGAFVASRFLKHINEEDLALENVTASLRALEESLDGGDIERLQEAAKRLRRASRVYSGDESDADSAFGAQYDGLIGELQGVLSQRIPSLLSQRIGPNEKRASLSRARDILQRLISLLMKPTLEGIKQLGDDTKDLEEKPITSRRPSSWKHFAESQRGRLVISGIFAFVALPLVAYVAGVFGPTPSEFRATAVSLIVGSPVVFFGCFAFLTYFKQK